jgi:DNA-binding SARP family transcriptional activator
VESPAAEAWRGFVAAPVRSRELARQTFGNGAKPHTSGWAGLCLAYHLARSAEVESAERTLAEVRDLFGSLKDGRGADLADVLQAYALIVRGQGEEAVHRLEAIAGRQAIDSGVAPLDRFLVYHGLALAYARLGQLERVLQHHYANVVLLERCGSPPPLAAVLLNLSGTLGAIDDWEEAHATAAWAVRCCEGMDNPVLRRRAEINLALTQRFLGRLDEALALLAALREKPLPDPGSDFALALNSAEALAVHGDLEEAQRCLAQARAHAARGRDPHQAANCDWISGLIASRRGDAAAAIEQLERAREAVLALKQVHIPLLPRIVEQLAGCYARTGDHERAFTTFQRFHELYQARLGYTIRARTFGRQSRHGAQSIDSIVRERGGGADALAEWARLNEALRRALARGDGSAPPAEGWGAAAIARVDEEARGLGVDAGELVERLHDASPGKDPPRVQVQVMGRFEVRSGGTPMRFGRKSPTRPLAVLKYLAACGPRGAAESEIADALWPDQDGDVALRSLAVNLHRLRKLLGDASTVVHRDRRLMLDARQVWSDAAAFELLLESSALASDEAERMRLAQRALDLYRGHFLADEEEAAWTIGVRERLRARFVTGCASLAARLAAAGRLQAARAFYARGLGVDPAVDELCLGMMRCSQVLGEPTTGIAAFRDLERALLARRARPAAALQALYAELLKRA